MSKSYAGLEEIDVSFASPPNAISGRDLEMRDFTSPTPLLLSTSNHELPPTDFPLVYLIWKKIFPKAFFGWVIVFSCSLIWIIIAPAASFGFGYFVERFLEDTGEKRTLLSTYWTIALICASFSSPLMGRGLDKIGPRKMLFVLVPMNSLGLFLLTFVRYVHFLLPIIIILRVAQLALINTIFVLLGQWFSVRRGRASAVSGFVGGLTFVTPSVQNFLGEYISWRSVILSEAIFVTIFGVMICFVSVSNPEEIGLFPDGALSKIRPDQEEGGEGEPGSQGVDMDDYTLREAVRTKVFWIVTSAFVTIAVYYSGFNLHHTDILAEQGVDGKQAGTITFLALTGTALIANICGGFLVERLNRQKHRTCALATLFGCVSILILLFGVRHGNLLVATFGAIYGPMETFLFLTQSDLFPSFFGRKNVGAILSLSNGFYSFALGIGPILLAFCKDFAGSYRWPLITLGALLGVQTIVLSFPLSQTKQKM